ncbi:MAG: hypothetical protein VYD19_09985 [Myxococcota bacterium]|nr:hypothetical protein [Myxococcota bacterium]
MREVGNEGAQRRALSAVRSGEKRGRRVAEPSPLPPLTKTLPAPSKQTLAMPPLPPLSELNMKRDGVLGGTRVQALAKLALGGAWHVTDEESLSFTSVDGFASGEWEEVEGRVIGLKATLQPDAYAFPMVLLGLVSGDVIDPEGFGPWERSQPPLRPVEGVLQRADGRNIHYWARFSTRCEPMCGLEALHFRLGRSAAP